MITEDGTGVEGANSYCSLDVADAYHEDRANGAWANLEEPMREAYLIRATDYIEATYRALGSRISPLQGLQAPTVAFPGLSASLAAATAYLAFRASQGPLDQVERGIKTTKKALEGVGSTETIYDEPERGDPYPIVTGLIAGVMTPRNQDEPVTVISRRMSR